MKLAPLVFVRPGGLRAAEWTEIDLEASEWRIAAHRAKMRRPHLVPLSHQARAVLREIQPLTGRGRYVFPSPRAQQRPLSDNVVTAVLRRMGYAEHNELGFSPDVIELQLAHRSQWEADILKSVASDSRRLARCQTSAHPAGE